MMTVFASLTLADACLVLFFSETKGKELPDTVVEAEKKNNNQEKITLPGFNSKIWFTLTLEAQF